MLGNIDTEACIGLAVIPVCSHRPVRCSNNSACWKSAAETATCNDKPNVCEATEIYLQYYISLNRATHFVLLILLLCFINCKPIGKLHRGAGHTSYIWRRLKCQFFLLLKHIQEYLHDYQPDQSNDRNVRL
jgi:hypothetical protein